MAIQPTTPTTPMPPLSSSSQTPTQRTPNNSLLTSLPSVLPMPSGSQLPDSSLLSTPQTTSSNNSVSTKLPSTVPNSSQLPTGQIIYQSIPTNSTLLRPNKRTGYFQIASNSTSHKRVRSIPQHNRRKRAPAKSWTNDHNPSGKSSLDLIIHWLTSEGNYESWRGGKKPKCQLAEQISDYLAENGMQDRNGRGVEQQVAILERKFHKAFTWKTQTGQGMLDEAEQAQRNQELDKQRRTEQSAEATEEEQVDDFVQIAKNKISAQLQKMCPFYLDLEPIFSQYPNLKGRAEPNQESLGRMSSTLHPDMSPTSSSEGRQQSEAQSNIIVQSISNPTTTRQSSNSTRRRNESNNYQSIYLPEETLHSDNQMVDTIYTHLDYSHCQPLSERSGELNLMEFERHQLELEMQKQDLKQKKIREEEERQKFQLEKEKRMIELAKAKIELQASEQSIKIASQREQLDQVRQSKQEFAKMVQDFIKAGLALDDAMKATREILGPLNDVS